MSLVNQDANYKNFAVFYITPSLFTIAFGAYKIPNITKKSKKGLLCVIKKLGLSVVLFILFFPFYLLTNNLNIVLNSAPDFFNLESWVRGFIVWSMVFCFYVGLFLLAFAIIDLLIVIKDLSTRKPRKPKEIRNAAQ
jgi:hypothetical protein